MNNFLLDLLRCPYCFGKFTVVAGDAQLDRWEYAILNCYCDNYPVVAGIPIIRKGTLGARGETTKTVSQLIRSGMNQDALLAMVMPRGPASGDLAPKWIQRLPQVKGVGRVRNVLGRPAFAQWKARAHEFLLQDPKRKVAKDYFTFLVQSGMEEYDYHYFMNRFGQPRHLVALSLMTLIDPARKPVLDFGCGFGHLTTHLPRRVGEQPIIGVDRDFMRAYVAKNFLAREAFYVCCDGSASLPFMNGFFSVVYSSDTLYMVGNKVICSREMMRVTDRHGLIIVAGIRNSLVQSIGYQTMPHYTYSELFDSLPHRTLANRDVLSRYVTKRGPALVRSSDKQTLDHEAWFSLVATKREELLVDRGAFEDWPHVQGVLELNPLYHPIRESGNETAETLYCRRFPSNWYEHEDGDCRKYEPDTVLISSQVLQDLLSQKRTIDMEHLIAQCVIIGIPERFH